MRAARPLNMYLLPQRLDKMAFVGTIVIYLAIINYLKIFSDAGLGQFNRATLLTSLALMPVTPLGIWIGTWLTRRLPAPLFFSTCYVLVFVVGVKLLWDGASRVLS